MNSRLTALLVAACGAAAVSSQTPPGKAPATLMTRDSVNVFRRFSVERERDLAFYADAIGIQPLTGRFSLGNRSANILKYMGGHPGATANTTSRRSFPAQER